MSLLTYGDPLSLAVPMLVHFTLMFVLLTRFGILAVITAYTSMSFVYTFPVTLDPSNWYFSHGMVAQVLIIALAGLGFYLVAITRRKHIPDTAS